MKEDNSVDTHQRRIVRFRDPTKLGHKGSMQSDGDVASSTEYQMKHLHKYSLPAVEAVCKNSLQ